MNGGHAIAKTRVDSPALLETLDQARTSRGLSWRQLAVDAGVTPSLLARIRNGYKPDADGFMTLVRWLGMPAETFLVPDDSPVNQPELAAELAPLLRSRKELDDADVAAIQDVVAATLRVIAAKRARVREQG